MNPLRGASSWQYLFKIHDPSFLIKFISYHHASKIRLFKNIGARFCLSFLSVSPSFYTPLDPDWLQTSRRRRKLVSGIPFHPASPYWSLFNRNAQAHVPFVSNAIRWKESTNVDTTTAQKKAALNFYEKRWPPSRPNYVTWKANHTRPRSWVLYLSATPRALATLAVRSMLNRLSIYRLKCTTHCTLSANNIIAYTPSDFSKVFKLLSDITGNAVSTQALVDLSPHHRLQSFNATHPTLPS